MYGSSGPAETAAINQASKAWAAQSGNKVIVTNASNLTEQLDEAFAGGTPYVARSMLHALAMSCTRPISPSATASTSVGSGK